MNPILSLPRILCLHGGGTNARIFRAQCRRFIAELSAEFRFVFAEAPFISEAGPDVLSVYGQWGPFKRWLRWQEGDPEIPAAEAVDAIYDSLAQAMRQDDEAGGTGDWIAVLGFSQGAKICASLLYRQQLSARDNESPGVSFGFGVLLAGRLPLVSLDRDPSKALDPNLPDASQIPGAKCYNSPETLAQKQLLRLPTIHVHGLRDPGLMLHRRLLESCEEVNRVVIEWDGDHRVPLKLEEVSRVARQIRQFAKETSAAR